MSAANRAADVIGTLDVSLPPAPGAVTVAARALADFVLAVLMVLALPFVIVIGAPIAVLALLGVMFVQRFQDK